MKTLATVLSLCTTLAACGGGGGAPDTSSNTDTKSVPLTAENYGAAATEIMASSTTLGGNSSPASNLFLGASVQTTPSITNFVQSKLPDLIKRLGTQRPQFIGAISTEEEQCTSGGSLSFSMEDMNGNKLPDPGDYVTISANDCVDTDNRLKLNGQMKITFKSYTEADTAKPDAFTASLSVQSNQFSSEINGVTTVAKGSFEMDITSDYVLHNGFNKQSNTIKIRASSLNYNISTAGSTKIYEYRNYVLETTTFDNQVGQSINGSINIPTLGSNTATIKTLKNFVSPVASTASSLPYPTDGIALVTFKQGGTIRATANGTSNALVELDQDGDGKFETSKQVPWSDIL